MCAALTGGAGPSQGQGAFFLCDVFGVVPKNDMASMEHPLFSLATRPDRRILNYEHKGTAITVTPSVKGLATIHDKDILIFCISQLMAALNAGRSISRTLHLKAHDLLIATNRETSGDAYRRLREAFERLAGTRITTNIATGGVEVTKGFGLIESWEIVRRAPTGRGSGRMTHVAVTLSDWLYQAVLSNAVLTLNRDYFSLRKPLERRIYELVRKHCGRQQSWTVSVDTLLKKSGSASPRRVFRKMLRDMIAAQPLPDYALEEQPGDLIYFSQKQGVVERSGARPPALRSETLEQGREMLPGADIYALEAEWRGMWARSGAPRLRSPDAAFLGWLRKRVGR
ncbi:replication initiator protein A [Parasedimentitalea psychrophila]|uniref:Replication initiator protein A n=1 Tax=Parasedimentitalea psychrophila TaxID=2997337 RepID=A0A9Y2P6V6_9RHOB|nr:replication initiator protein A [Parasedimentitalea psychrophila]WIY27824.1 replication initiator protein A [Parasedimentitalea psychrophila]